MLDANAITALFTLFDQGDEELLSLLRSRNPNAIKDRQWHFLLPDLATLYQSYYRLEQLDYILFRKLLFNSPINQQLQQHKLCIKIAKPATHVDTTLYVLRRELNQASSGC